MDKLSCIFLNTYYPAFLQDFYGQRPSLTKAPHTVQIKVLEESRFGESDFYSKGLVKAGWSARNIIVNCEQSQRAWAEENSCSGAGLNIAIQQIREARPSVVYIHDLSIATQSLIEALRPHTSLIVGQIACPLSKGTFLRGLDIIFTSFPHYVRVFRSHGLNAYYMPLAFDPAVLQQLGQARDSIPVSFIGGISTAHTTGVGALEKIYEQIPFQLWGYGAETLPADCQLRKTHNGPAWGLQMFSLLGSSLITINRHIDVAANYANNMRLFEATGCGAMLVTDHKDNLADLFEIGEEVVAYRTTDEAAALIEYYLSHPDEAKSIAAAGQKRVLKDHTYEKRMQKVGKILHRHLRYKDEHKRLPKLDLNAISHGYSNVAEKKITSSMWSAWQNASIPKKQRALVQKELSDMYRGQQPVIYNVLAEIVRPYVRDQSSILEIGCASGYYYEILEYLLGKNIKYVGVDISEHLIEMARDYYPGVIFEIADGAKLPYEDEQFEITISSTVLLHVRNYIAHIREAARVSQRYVVFHRTPICRKRETQIQSKFGYGVEMVEFRYKESDLLATFAQNGLRLLNSIEYVSNPAEDVYETTYLLERGVLSPATAASPGRAHTQSAPRPEITVVETDRLQASGPGIERPIDQIAFHRLNPADPFYANLVKNPQEAGLTESDLEGKPESRRAELIIGEYFARLSQYCGQVASRLLFKAQWQYVTPDWFDQRHHLLDTEKWFNDYWTESADNVLRVLPYRGRLLDLCCGDGFYDYYFYRKRASEVICVDINETAYRQACRLHSADNITYHLASVLTFEPEPGSFDVVVIRGAIEHFSQENQQLLFRKALKAMKPDGWFCGDTPANPDKNEHKQLPAHENEWADEAEMKRELQQVFEHVETCAIETEERTTLFWRCRKCQPVNAE